MTSQFKTTTVANGGSSGSGIAKSGKLYKSQFDVATIVIRITDINDHAPEFRPGSCYPLAIPENSETSVVHRVVATDLDEGPNGDITYSITGTIGIFAYKRLIFPHSLVLLTFFRINGSYSCTNSIYIFMCTYLLTLFSRLAYCWPQTDQTFSCSFLSYSRYVFLF